MTKNATFNEMCQTILDSNIVFFSNEYILTKDLPSVVYIYQAQVDDALKRGLNPKQDFKCKEAKQRIEIFYKAIKDLEDESNT